jgi:hypothetical protein
MATSILGSLAAARPAEARTLIFAALDAAEGDRTAAAKRLQASKDLPAGKRGAITLHEIIRRLDMGDEIRARYKEQDAARATVRGKKATAGRVKQAARTEAEKKDRA